MNDPLPPEAPVDPADAAARRGSQIALLLFLMLSCVFVASSTWQFTRAVFFATDPSEGPQPRPRTDPSPCADGRPASPTP